MSRRTLATVLAAFVAGGLLVWAAIAIFGGKDDSKKVAGPELSTTTTLALTPTAQELLDRLHKGSSLEFHATYASSDTSGSTLTVDIWRKNGKVRQDISLEAGGVKNQIEGLQLPDGNVSCQKSPDVDWVCQKAQSLATQNGQAAGFFEAAAANLNGKAVTARDEKVGSDDARCYSIDVATTTTTATTAASTSSSGSSESSSSEASTSPTQTSSEMCVTAEGIPVRLSSQGSDLTLSSIERSVDDSVFTPPAAITQATAPTTAN